MWIYNELYIIHTVTNKVLVVIEKIMTNNYYISIIKVLKYLIEEIQERMTNRYLIKIENQRKNIRE